MKALLLLFILLVLGFFSVCSAFMEKGEYISGDM